MTRLSEKIEREKEKRFAAIVLPELVLELSAKWNSNPTKRQRFVVVQPTEPGVVGVRERVIGVSTLAFQAGVRVGHTVLEATGCIADLEVREIRAEEVEAALLRVGETLARYGSPVAVEFTDRRSEGRKEFALLRRETIWVDITGSAELFGGEEALASEIAEQVRLLGHMVRVVIASGPGTAQAIARYASLSPEGTRIVSPGEERDVLSELPIFCLGLLDEQETWLTGLGILSTGALTALPLERLAPRLGKNAREVLDLALGRECWPLKPCVFPQKIAEKSEFEEPLQGLSPLLFVLRGLIAKVCARLLGRAQAITQVRLEIFLEPGAIRHQGGAASQLVELILAAPLHQPAQLERILKTRLETVELSARAVAIELSVAGLTDVPANQLGFSPGASSESEELPVLLQELAAEIGEGNVGLLEVADSHRPETRSRLRRWFEKKRGTAKRPERRESLRELDRITRLLAEPIPFTARLAEGELVMLGARSYQIARIEFIERLDGVEWWKMTSTNRDYYWVWLRSADVVLETLVFREKRDGGVYLHGFYD